jgi:uncharacterized membrane protein (DUF373 family)
MRGLLGLFRDEAFLGLIDHFERVLAKILSLMLCLVLIAATVQLVFTIGGHFTDPNTGWLGSDLLVLLGDVLTLLIALEVLQNVTAYLRSHVVQIELVMLTALTAVARKVIVLEPGAEDKPLLLVGLGITLVSLAAGYWLVRKAEFGKRGPRTLRSRGSREADR